MVFIFPTILVRDGWYWAKSTCWSEESLREDSDALDVLKDLLFSILPPPALGLVGPLLELWRQRRRPSGGYGSALARRPGGLRWLRLVGGGEAGSEETPWEGRGGATWVRKRENQITGKMGKGPRWGKGNFFVRRGVENGVERSYSPNHHFSIYI